MKGFDVQKQTDIVWCIMLACYFKDFIHVIEYIWTNYMIINRVIPKDKYKRKNKLTYVFNVPEIYIKVK